MLSPSENPVSEFLTGPPDLSSWLSTIGILAMGMTPLGLIFAGVWGAVLTSAFFIFVWLASMIWVFARHGSLGDASVLPSSIMVSVWPAAGVVFAIFG